MSSVLRLVADGFLVAGFGVQHSVLAMLRTKRFIKRKTGVEPLAWRSVESLVNVVYILVAAALWYHTNSVVWKFGGALRIIFLAGAILSWLWYWELHLYEYDCGLAFGSTTLVAPLARAEGPKLIPWKVGSRRWIRFPVHTAFFGMFFLLPTMTEDLLVLAVVLNVYNVIGSVLYDKRLLKTAGRAYKEYVDVTGLIWPPIYRSPAGAKSLEMPAPQHWRKPSMHVPGLAAGVVLGLFYSAAIGLAVPNAVSMIRVGVAGLAGAIMVGLVLGRVLKPRASDWGQEQTDLSTTIALSAATGVIVWVCIEWVMTGHAPIFAAYLPLWFTVQYLGHVFGFLASRGKWSAVLAKEASDEQIPAVADAPAAQSGAHA